jgi:tRNA (mo5U34)-methyltransferase
MFDYRSLAEDLQAVGLADWQRPVEAMLRDRFRAGAHGKYEEWQSILQELPDISVQSVELNGDVVRIVAEHCDDETRATLRRLLLALLPWRKGPFDVCGVAIDSEWRSNLKWQRVRPVISELRDRKVLDVGCGNGYYALRISGQSARFVMGIEPTLQYVVQFQAAQHYARQPHVQVLPLRLADLPSGGRAFDTTLSMGVLYHQRDPQEHLRQLRETLRDGGELVLETLIAPGEQADVIVPDDRYARMRNVWHLPTLPLLQRWLGEAGFDDCRVGDISVTGEDEQRSTEWMPFESLDQALDAANPGLTVEGLPRPRRAVLVTHARP